ncbi:MAG: TetM/TetW/TetO/TetS family tetracycline resistance ribosomal protection protein, partial [Flavobacteriales bacterium]|nr:TetM/TetW/TetO/TetS family tetracycline resistance ribosomal protection protein [Flavobacteriales bacterium]
MYKKKLTMGIFAHANAGKTTITEHMLYHMKVIDKVGRVDMGNTVSDSMKVEKQRGISVKNSLISFELEDTKIQLLDTPGHVDFSAEVERAISVLDGAVLVLSGVEGVEAQTHVIWEALKKKNIPVIIFINKLDRKGADYSKVVEELIDKLQIPIIAMYDFTVGEEMLLRKERSIVEIAEQASDVDEKLLEYIINNKELDQEYLFQKVVTLAHSAKVYPVIGGSALKDDGLDILFQCIRKFLKPYVNKDDEKLSAFVYAVKSDFSTRDVYVKILQGTLESRSMITADGETHQKVKELLVPQGEKLIQVDKVYSGEIAIIRGLDIACNQFIGEVQEKNEKLQFVNPQLIMEVKAKDDCETIGLMKALRILTEEDPYLDVTLDTSINSIFIKLIGEIQAQIIESVLMERFNIPICLSNPMVLYKETPTRIGRAKVSYTSVSAIELQVRPLEMGSGFVYNSKISTDY